MRTTLVIPLLLGLALTGGACLLAPSPSIHPFLAPGEGAVLPGLGGEWIDAEGDDPDSIEFTPTGDTPTDTWTLRMREGQDRPPEELTIRLGRIGEELYWDMTVPEEDAPPLLSAHRLPLHTLARVRLDADRLEIAFLDSDWLEKRAASGEPAVAHLELEDGGIVLTAPTRDLQAAILETPDDAFGETSTFVRRGSR